MAVGIGANKPATLVDELGAAHGAKLPPAFYLSLVILGVAHTYFILSKSVHSRMRTVVPMGSK